MIKETLLGVKNLPSFFALLLGLWIFSLIVSGIVFIFKSIADIIINYWMVIFPLIFLFFAILLYSEYRKGVQEDERIKAEQLALQFALDEKNRAEQLAIEEQKRIIEVRRQEAQYWEELRRRDFEADRADRERKLRETALRMVAEQEMVRLEEEKKRIEFARQESERKIREEAERRVKEEAMQSYYREKAREENARSIKEAEARRSREEALKRQLTLSSREQVHGFKTRSSKYPVGWDRPR